MTEGDPLGSIVAVLDKAGTPCGAGFLAATGKVLTCAHVVSATGAGPGEQVQLQFIHLAGTPVCRAAVDREGWRPVDEQDVAVLELRDVPAGAQVLSLGTATGCRDHRVAAFGFPASAPGGRFGYAHAGDLLPDDDRRGRLLQLADANDLTVGFSGAPVLDETSGLVIGMVTSINPGDEYRRGYGVAYATAAQTLRNVVPSLVETVVCPYPGLASFTTAQADWFHGRSAAVRMVIEALRHKAVLLLGPSGSGKSSLINAGILPALAGGLGPPGCDCWEVACIRPQPELFAELNRVGLAGAAGLENSVRQRAASVPHGSRLLLIIDQFEELLIEPITDGRRTVLAELAAATRRVSAFSLVLVMRDDFYPRLAALAPDLMRPLLPGLVNVPTTLDAEELYDIVVRPADSVGLRFEAGLAEQIVTDISSGPRTAPVTALPLLGLTLQQLWRRRSDGRLTHDGYRRAGRITGSLTALCDQAITALPAGQEPVAQRMLTALVRPADEERHVPAVRKQVPLADLRDLAADFEDRGLTEVDAVLRAMTNTTPLIVTHNLPGTEGHDAVAELIHDSLITEWATLRQWVEQDHRFQDWLRRVDEQARRWAATGDLLHGLDLSEGMEWSRQRRLPSTVAALLTASQGAARSRLRRARVAVTVMAVLLVSALAATGMAISQQHSARTAQRVALSRQLAAQSKNLSDSDPDLAALLAVNAYRIRATDEALNSLEDAASAARSRRPALTGHASAVNAVAFSPDGRTLATAGDDSTVRLWTMATGASRTLTFVGMAVKTVMFSPNGRYLAIGGVPTPNREWLLGRDYSMLRLWNLATGVNRAIGPDNSYVTAVAFSPDGRMIAATGLDNTVGLWDVASGAKRATLVGHQSNVLTMAFSPNGKTLATGSNDCTVRLWNVATAATMKVITLRDAAVLAVTFSPDGRTLATTGTGGSAQLWNVATGASTATLTGQSGAVSSAAFSPDGRIVATGGYDHSVRLWDADTGTSLATLVGHVGEVTSVSFSPDGKTLATGSNDRTARVWDVTASLTRPTAQFNAGGRGNNSGWWRIVISRDGSVLAVTGSDSSTQLWDVASATRRARLNNPVGVVSTMAFGPDGRTIATAGSDRAVQLWDVATGRLLTDLTADSDKLAAISFGPDGRTLIAADLEGGMHRWSPISGSSDDKYLLADPTVLDDVGGTIYSEEFSRDGKLLATTSADGLVRLWNAESGTKIATLTGHTNAVTAVAFSPDGRTLATGSLDRTARLWNISSGALRITLTGHSDNVSAVAFSPDGKTVATASWDGTVRLWNIASGASRGILASNVRYVSSMAYSPSGDILAVADANGQVAFWNAATPGAVEAEHQICRAVGHDLDSTESAQFLHGQFDERACTATLSGN